MFLNTFHREHILLKLKIKKLLRKIKSKNLKAEVWKMPFYFFERVKHLEVRRQPKSFVKKKKEHTSHWTNGLGDVI